MRRDCPRLIHRWTENPLSECCMHCEAHSSMRASGLSGVVAAKRKPIKRQPIPAMLASSESSPHEIDIVKLKGHNHDR